LGKQIHKTWAHTGLQENAYANDHPDKRSGIILRRVL